MTTDKLYISANSLLEDSYRLAMQVIDSGYQPTHIVGIWRGGAPVGIAVQ
ncbi:MAG: hypoxanthine phosphoribosyltransferase, partial [Blastomonas fulva]